MLLQLKIFPLLFALYFIFAISPPAFADTIETETTENTAQIAGPFMLSLLLSHGAGLYRIGQPQRAKTYSIAHVLLVDVPLVAMACGMIIHHIDPLIFQGEVLKVTEYVANTLLISFAVSAPVIRFFECRDVLRARSR